MLKKSTLLIILSAVFGLSAFLASARADKTVNILSKRDHAQKLWATSGHADAASEAFRHWDEDGSIPTSCARCHSTPGFRDYLGADGTAANVVDSAAPLGTTVECEVCHADPDRGILHDRTVVIFPSGKEVSGLGPESMCMSCHQGRASTKDVDASIASAGVEDDTVSSKLRFINIHYYAASATQFGTVASGGYQYAGKSYDARFSHIPGYNACNTCHNPHSLEVDLEACQTCHTGVKDPKDIRFFGSFEDYDGDGNITEGVYYEIESLKEILYNSIKTYAREVVGVPIAYDEHTYPYFFIDKNGNGVVDSDEATSANGYNKFTPRLTRAAYNFQVSKKDPNGFAHGGKYIIELVFDSIEDLDSAVEAEGSLLSGSRPKVSQGLQPPVPVRPFGKSRSPLRSGAETSEDQTQQPVEPGIGLGASLAHAALHRTDEGHFDGSAMPWRDWDSDGAVPATCAKCHSAEGLPYLLENGKIDKALSISNGLLCSTCHTEPPLTRFIGPVTFPSGISKDLGDSSNLCLNCHQGRAAKITVDRAIAAGSGPYGFTNIHYFAAAASYFGSEVKGGYEFNGKTYAGRNIYTNHGGRFTNCVECHFGTKSPNRKQDDSDNFFHQISPSAVDCVLCHGQDIAQPHPGSDPEKFEFEGIRPAQTPDYDADGNRTESLRDEILGLEAALLTQMQAYAASIGKPLAYDENTYPYYFGDTNGNGVVDAEEVTTANRYRFTASQLRAAYNYQMSKKEPCAYIHNPLYIGQLLVDSIEHLGGDVKSYGWR